jgi:hypothetical protein
MATLATPKPANIPQAKSYTRDEVQTALALLDEVKTPQPDGPRRPCPIS